MGDAVLVRDTGDAFVVPGLQKGPGVVEAIDDPRTRRPGATALSPTGRTLAEACDGLRPQPIVWWQLF